MWRRMRRMSKVIAWILVLLVGGSMVAYFALLLPFAR
jgi:hypothetical protein